MKQVRFRFPSFLIQKLPFLQLRSREEVEEDSCGDGEELVGELGSAQERVGNERSRPVKAIELITPWTPGR